MKQIVNPEMITLARESRGLTQTELADRLKVSQGKISKIEQGLLSATEEIINDLSGLLNYPILFFYNTDKLNSGNSFHRKRLSLGSKLLNKIDAQINIRLFQVKRLLKSIEITNQNIPFIDINNGISPVEIAIELRKLWQVPKGPISNLVNLIESNGGIVILFNFNTQKIDGLTLQTNNLSPVIFLNNSITSDRLRFTLAHELGHTIMHQFPSDTMEIEANKFASEFLMPKAQITHQLYNLNFYKLADLKKFWKVSMSALIVRATELNLLSDSQSKKLWIELSKAGFKTKEPIEIPREYPTLLNEILNLHKNDLNYSKEDLCQILQLNIDEFDEIYDQKVKILKLIPN